MTIETWMPSLASVVGTVPGMEQVHTFDNLPAKLMVFPCAVIMPLQGTQTYSAGGLNIAIHKLRITFYFAAQVLPEAMGAAVPFISRLRSALAANVTLGGLVDHLLPIGPPDAFYEGPGAISYAGLDMTGINFNVEVKERESGITVSA